MNALSISVVNSHPEDQLMHTLLDNFHQNGKYSTQIDSHQAELRRKEKLSDQKLLNISSLQTDYQNIDRGSVFWRNSERANTIQTECTICVVNNHSAEKKFKRIVQEK